MTLESGIDDRPYRWKPTVDAPYSSDEEKEHLAAIGMVANEWAWLEFQIDYYTMEILGLPEDSATCLAAQVFGSARKLDAYISACRLRGASKAGKPLEDFAKQTAALAETRNRYIHDSWIVPMPPLLPHRFEMTARRTMRKGGRKTPTGEVLALAIKIMEHRERLDALHAGFLAEVGTSPEKPHPASPQQPPDQHPEDHPTGQSIPQGQPPSSQE